MALEKTPNECQYYKIFYKDLLKSTIQSLGILCTWLLMHKVSQIKSRVHYKNRTQHLKEELFFSLISVILKTNDL